MFPEVQKENFRLMAQRYGQNENEKRVTAGFHEGPCWASMIYAFYKMMLYELGPILSHIESHAVALQNDTK